MAWIVTFVESERGWGQSYFDETYETYDEAKRAFDAAAAAKNTASTAPDWYIAPVSIKEAR